MRKIKHIATREFLTRVRKKSFLLSTLMGPILMIALLIVPFYFSTDNKQETSSIAYVNFPFEIPSTQGVSTQSFTSTSNTIPDSILYTHDIAILFIPQHEEPIVHYYFNKDLPLVEAYITTTIQNNLYNLTLPLYKKVRLESPKATNNSVLLFYSYAAPILIYFFIFLYGMQIMKGITEEKTNRIIEVLLCTVKPFELMLGKILGIFTLALVQFSVWGISTLSIYSLFYSYFKLDRFEAPFVSGSMNGISDDFGQQLHSLVTTLTADTIVGLAAVFIIYFIGGYFLFGALFAIVGAASDPDTDTQQFIFPITIPLITSFMLLDYNISSPHSTTAIAMSIFPLTSPIIMPACFGATSIEWWRLALSIISLVVGFLTLTWVASRIYRIGVLSSGSKVTYKTLVKWFMMKG